MNQAATTSTISRGALAGAIQKALADRGITLVNPAAEDMASVAPSAQEHDLGQLLQNLLSQANAKAAAHLQAQGQTETKEETKPALTAADVFEFIPVKNKQGRYVLVLPQLREFIYTSMDTSFMSGSMLEMPSDSDEVKASRRRAATISLENFYREFHDFKDVTEDDVLNSGSGLTYEAFQLFFNDLETRRNAFVSALEAEAKIKYDNAIAAFNSGTVTFNDLHTGLQAEAGNRSMFVFKIYGQDIAGKIARVRRESSMFRGEYLQVSIEVHSANSQGLNKVYHVHEIDSFPETMTLKELQVIRLSADPELKKKLLERGINYLNLTKAPSYVRSTGMLTRRYPRSIEVVNAIGRVMIDLGGMETMDPQYHTYFCKSRDDAATIPFKSVDDLDEDVKLSCVPFVYGFSFKAKRWGEMNISDMTPIEFRKDAYEKLVLDQDTKNLIFASVTDNSSDNDLIAGKGGGSINLLEGPPGVGKTLTAEAVAEMLQKPLYMVSVGELGTTVDELENNLKEILEIAASWEAVLLIDEADIFLETRDKSDVIRNAMVAVFLRLLEYYQGVMFLTTNRADNLDPAFESRITLCIHYTELSYDSRVAVWTNLLSAAKLSDHKFNVQRLANHVLNGRQIKGVIKSARALARFENDNLHIDHFERVIKQKADFKAAAVYKMGHGLGDAKDVIDVEVKEVSAVKPGLFRRIWNAVLGA